MYDEFWKLKRVADNIPDALAQCYLYRCVEGRYTPFHKSTTGFYLGVEHQGRFFRAFKMNYLQVPHVEVYSGNLVLFVMPRKTLTEIDNLVREIVENTLQWKTTLGL